jgi:WhiB family redox-sensing transcriptional regulator
MEKRMRQHDLARLLIRLFDGGLWRSMAACRSADPDLFFPVSASAGSQAQVAEAKAVCARCLVRRQCLDFAIRTRQVHGIWGGMTEQERYRP